MSFKGKEDKKLRKGMVFNNLKIIDSRPITKEGLKGNTYFYYLCECKLCGRQKYILKGNLIYLKQKSCGCLRHPYGYNTNKRLNKIYSHMKDRCYNSNNFSYYKYGAKGITICDEWLNDRTTFFNWALENGYKDNLSIDRIDGTKGYYPQNCRWATAKQQARNICTNRTLTINGQTKLLCEWAEEYKLNPSTIIGRIKKGYSGNDLIVKNLRVKEVN